MHVARSLTSSIMGPCLRHTIPQLCRTPLTTQTGHLVDIKLGVAAANRDLRTKQSCLHDEANRNLLHEAEPGGTSSDVLLTSTAASPATRARSKKVTSVPTPKNSTMTKSQHQVFSLEVAQPHQIEGIGSEASAAPAKDAAASKLPSHATAPLVKPRTRQAKIFKVAETALNPDSLSEAVAAGILDTRSVLTTNLTQQSTLPEAINPHTALSGLLLIVDGNYLANRSFFGYGSRRLSTSKGVPTSVTYGVMRVLQAALRHVRPTSLAVVFDSAGPTFRTALSLLDPTAGPWGALAARGGPQLTLDWKGVASKLLGLSSVLEDMQSAARAEAAATPVSYLHPSGRFLPPPRPLHLSVPRVLTSATDLLTLLVSALGPEQAMAFGLTDHGGTAISSAAESIAPPPYKAGRVSKSAEFYDDLINLQRLLGLMSVVPLSRPWLEADDLAGLLVQDAVRQGMAVRILSGDRDLMQLVSDQHDVALLYPATSLPSKSSPSSVSPSRSIESVAGTELMTLRNRSRHRAGTTDFPFVEFREADVVSALGVAPPLVPDFKALTGDSSDCLPGVKGIGPKTAVELLGSYGNLAGVRRAAISKACKMSDKRRAAIRDEEPIWCYTLAMARVLGSPDAPTLPDGVLPDGLLNRLQLRGFDFGMVRDALEELEMKSLVRSVSPGGELFAAFGGLESKS